MRKSVELFLLSVLVVFVLGGSVEINAKTQAITKKKTSVKEKINASEENYVEIKMPSYATPELMGEENYLLFKSNWDEIVGEIHIVQKPACENNLLGIRACWNALNAVTAGAAVAAYECAFGTTSSCRYARDLLADDVARARSACNPF